MPQERERGPRATALRGRSRRPRLTPPSRSREKMAPMRPPLALAARRSGPGTRTSTAAAAAAEEEEDAEVEQQRRRRQCRRRLCGDERFWQDNKKGRKKRSPFPHSLLVHPVPRFYMSSSSSSSSSCSECPRQKRRKQEKKTNFCPPVVFLSPLFRNVRISENRL